MEENEFVSAFFSRITYLKDKMGDIGESISGIDHVTIILNGMS